MTQVVEYEVRTVVSDEDVVQLFRQLLRRFMVVGCD